MLRGQSVSPAYPFVSLSLCFSFLCTFLSFVFFFVFVSVFSFAFVPMFYFVSDVCGIRMVRGGGSIISAVFHYPSGMNCSTTDPVLNFYKFRYLTCSATREQRGVCLLALFVKNGPTLDTH